MTRRQPTKAEILKALKIDANDPDAIADQLDRERKYRYFVMTTAQDRKERAHYIRESKRRTQILTDCYNDWIMKP